MKLIAMTKSENSILGDMFVQLWFKDIDDTPHYIYSKGDLECWKRADELEIGEEYLLINEDLIKIG